MATFYRWRWWTVALRGVAAILFGIVALRAPGLALVTLVYVFGVYALLDGLLALGLAAGPGVPRGAMIARGIESIIAGVLVMLLPGVTALVLLFVIAGWAVVSGALEIAMAVRMRRQIQHEWLLALEGALSIGFGVLLLIAPLAGAIVLGLWVGAYALVLGGMEIATGLRLRSAGRTPLAA